VLFTADHGDMMGDHHLHRKCYAYEGSARIPLLIRYPKGLDAPRGVFTHVVGLQDVMPTLLEIAGVEIPPSVTGRSVLRAVRGEAWREFFHGEHSPCYSPEVAMQYLTDGKEKYIWFPVTGEEQFFNIECDRQELHDLARDPAFAERVALWRRRLTELLGRRGDGFSDGEKLIVRPDGYGPEATPPMSAAGGQSNP
jgi:arylsulfatase A-like enzyme